MDIDFVKIDETIQQIKKLVDSQNLKLHELNENVKELINQRSDFIPLVTIAQEVKKSRQTLRYYITSNCEPEVDFVLKDGKILISSRIVPRIKEHYEKN